MTIKNIETTLDWYRSLKRFKGKNRIKLTIYDKNGKPIKKK